MKQFRFPVLKALIGATLLFAAAAFAPAQVPIPASGAQGSAAQGKKVSNVFQDTDLKQALSDLGAAAGTSIVPDDTVQGNVTATIKDLTIEQALDLLLLPGGYSWTRIGDAYLVGKAEPTSPNFLRFATSRTYKPNFTTAEKLVALLPTGMAGYVKAVAGDRSITITAAPAMMDRIMQDVRLLDMPGVRIVLEAMITEANTETLNQYDFSFIWKTFGFTSDVNAQNMQFQYSKATQTDVATLKALIGKGLASIKASPRIMTLEGKEASIEVGQESYFEVVSGPVNFPYTTLQQIKTGISLKMTPYLSDDGQITVQLNPEVSDVTGSGPGGLPINTVRRASTTVRVRAGETIIIGGMTFESKRRRDSKIPLLGDLPLLGNLFRFYRSETKKQDVIIMITPRILRDGEETVDLSRSLTEPALAQTTGGGSKTVSVQIPMVSINRATAQELAAIPEFGSLYASRLVEYRTKHGTFSSVDDIVRIPGFNVRLLEATRARLKL